MREVSTVVRHKYSTERQALKEVIAHRLKQAMSNLVGNQSHSDIILVSSDGQKIPGHSAIIRARAPGFYKKYISGNISRSSSAGSRAQSKSPSPSPRAKHARKTTPSDQNAIQIPNVDANSLQFFLTSIYTEDEVKSLQGIVRDKTGEYENDDGDEESENDEDSVSNNESTSERKDVGKRDGRNTSNKTYTIEQSPTKKKRSAENVMEDSVETTELETSMQTSTASEIDTHMTTSSDIQADISDQDENAPQALMTSFKQIAMESPTKEIKPPDIDIYDDVSNDTLVITQTQTLTLSSSALTLSQTLPAIVSPEISPTSLEQTFTASNFATDMTNSMHQTTPNRKEDHMIAKFIHFNELSSPEAILERDGVAFVTPAEQQTKPMFPMFVEFSVDKPIIFPSKYTSENTENVVDDFHITPMFNRKRQPSLTSLRSMDSADFAISPIQEGFRGIGQAESFPPEDMSSCGGLAHDLLSLYNTKKGADMNIQCSDGDIIAHKCILSVTCQYFAVELGDPSVQTIDLSSHTFGCVDLCMQFLYGGVTCVPNDVSVWEIASLARKLELEDFLDVARLHIRGKFCHFFHKPCGGCVAGTLDILASLESCGMDILLEECLEWQAKNFCRIWKTRAFAQLPDSVHLLCYDAALNNLSPKSVIDVILSCEKLQATLPRNARIGTAEGVGEKVSLLMESSIQFLAINLDHVITNESFLAQGKGLGLNIGLMEDLLPGVIHALAPDTGCRVLVRLYELIVFLTGQDLNRNVSPSHSDHQWNKRFTSLVRRLYELCDNHLIHNAAAVVKCEGWTLLTPSMQNRIKDAGIFVELRQPRAPPPKLSSFNRTYKRSSSSGARYVPSPSRDRSQSAQRKFSGSNQNTVLIEEAENVLSPRPNLNQSHSVQQQSPISASAVENAQPTTKVLSRVSAPVPKSAPVSRPSTAEASTRKRAESNPNTNSSKLPQLNQNSQTKDKTREEVPSPKSVAVAEKPERQLRRSKDPKDGNGTFIRSPKHKQDITTAVDTPILSTNNSSTLTKSTKKKVARQLTHELETPSPTTNKSQDTTPVMKPKAETEVVLSKSSKPVPMATVKPTISGQTVDRKMESAVTVTQSQAVMKSNTVTVKSDAKRTPARPTSISVQKSAAASRNNKTSSTNKTTSRNTSSSSVEKR